ncbi:UNVERIFIED_CONTAM: hypothetical protein B566_EDAN019197 [Ephemera danica]|nr:hypothetical protein B566_EDAN019197 [Ephemera danica]
MRPPPVPPQQQQPPPQQQQPQPQPQQPPPQQDEPPPPPAMVYGQLPMLSVDGGGRPTPEAWELFRDKLDSFFNVNKIPEAQKRDWLLSCPDYAQAMELLSTHIEPPSSMWYSRSKLCARMQGKGERVREYVAELRKIAAFCEFSAANFDIEVLSVLIRNMYNLEMQQRLMAQRNLTLDSAIQQVEAGEAATDYLIRMRNGYDSGSNVQTVNKAHHYRAELKGQPAKRQQQHGRQDRGTRPRHQQQSSSSQRREQGASSSAPLLRVDTPWQWTDTEERAIQYVRDTLSSPPLLRSFDNELPLILATDACQHGLGCVLSQVEDEVERPIMISFIPRDQIFATAVLFGLKKCRYYCAGRKITIIVDHKPLTGIFRGAGKPIPEVLSPRILRLCLQAAAFDYTLIYREGKKHNNADFCSRFPVDAAPQVTPDEPATVMFVSAGPQAAPVFAQAIARETAADPVTSQVLTAVKRGTPRQKLPKDVRAYMVGQPGALAVQAGCILFGARVVIPPVLRPQVLQRLHQHHQGIVRTKAVARSYCWWPQINSDIENLVLGCQICATRQPDPPRSQPQSWPQTSRPMQRIHLDFFGPIFNLYFLIMVDTFSGWLELSFGPHQDASTVISSCRLWFSYLGLPDECVCDNGPAFRAENFSIYLGGYGIRLTFTPPYHPASNGCAERAVRTIKMHLSKLQGAWKQQIPGLLFALRTTPNSSGHTPAELMMGRRLTTQFDRMNPSRILLPPTTSCDIQKWPVNTPLYYRHYTRNGYRGDKWLPGVVVSHEGTRILTIQCPDGTIVRRHLDQVRRRSSRPDADTRSCSQGADALVAAELAAAEAAREQSQRTPDHEPRFNPQVLAAPAQITQPNIVTQELRRSERLQSQNQLTPTVRDAGQVSVRLRAAARGGRKFAAHR